jgi:hypothetical protein
MLYKEHPVYVEAEEPILMRAHRFEPLSAATAQLHDSIRHVCAVTPRSASEPGARIVGLVDRWIKENPVKELITMLSNMAPLPRRISAESFRNS